MKTSVQGPKNTWLEVHWIEKKMPQLRRFRGTDLEGAKLYAHYVVGKPKTHSVRIMRVIMLDEINPS